MAPASTVLDIDTASRLRVAIARLSRRLRTTAAGSDAGLTPTRISVLLTIVREGPIRVSVLADLESLNPTMLSRIIKVLDERGLIRRMQDPGDLRAARVVVTPEGAQVHDRVRAERTRVLSDCLHGLPPDTAATLLAVVPDLETLAEALKPSARLAKG